MPAAAYRSAQASACVRADAQREQGLVDVGIAADLDGGAGHRRQVATNGSERAGHALHVRNPLDSPGFPGIEAGLPLAILTLVFHTLPLPQEPPR